MKYCFTAYGHPNILATHRTTLEITKDAELTKKGDCIIAVAADFSIQRIREIISSCQNGKIRLTIETAGIKEEVIAVANKSFSSDKEIVLRKGAFISERTLGTNADKAAADIDRALVEKLRNPERTVSVTIQML
ncbi:DUF371 domain-containing protein [Candidatus Woesearchaeota archaeon]|nr:DUF371 domain-containing protein [Candidatus Woesearchaeota archaeon]